jgi:hypothetical protein
MKSYIVAFLQGSENPIQLVLYLVCNRKDGKDFFNEKARFHLQTTVFFSPIKLFLEKMSIIYFFLPRW